MRGTSPGCPFRSSARWFARSPNMRPPLEPSEPRERSEDAWLRAVASRFPAGPRVVAGIGHDAACVRLDGRDAVLKTDAVIDGVDFRLAECGAEAAARKAIAVTASDLAATASHPRAALVAVALPRDVDCATFDALARGFAAAAKEVGCDLVGGDTSTYAGPLAITVSLVGEPGPMGVVLRSGALPGDALSVTGPLGGSILGRHLTFSPRLREALLLAERRIPHAMMDLSDGLAADLPRLCEASRCGADVEAERVPIHADARRVPGAGTPLSHALSDGEDFELLLAHAPLSDADLSDLAARGVVLHRIGTVTAEPGRLRLLEGGVAGPFPRGGFDHLRLAP
jgi:thiamine-monophosphate kinase